MMFYCYLKDPELQDSGYTRGYETGSLSYLVDGNITFNDIITYEPIADNDSSVTHVQNVEFSGKKGISEFYAKGFYSRNRAMSAWKKIRYDNSSYNKSSGTVYIGSVSSRIKRSEQPSLMVDSSNRSSYIKVDAFAGMGPNAAGAVADYDFKYRANVTDGVIEIWDATGWSNRTGSRRVDWEQTALLRGDFNITNNLRGENLFVPYGGLEPDEDWLSCCIRGDPPRIYDENGTDIGWPNRGTYAVLRPKQMLPTRKVEPINLSDPNDPCYQDCTKGRYSINSTRSTNCVREFNESFTCTEDKCSGFEGIYSCHLDEDEPVSPTTTHVAAGGPGIRVVKIHESGPKEEGNVVRYSIEVANNGETVLRNVNVTDILPEGMDYLNSNITDAQENPITSDFDPVKRINRTTESGSIALNITWGLKDIYPPTSEGDDTTLYILLNATLKSNTTKPDDNSVYVWGIYRDIDGEEIIVETDPRLTNTIYRI